MTTSKLSNFIFNLEKTDSFSKSSETEEQDKENTYPKSEMDICEKSTLNNCAHFFLMQYGAHSFCQECGLSIEQNGSPALSIPEHRTFPIVNCSPFQFLQILHQRSLHFQNIYSLPQCIQQERKNILETLFQIGEDYNLAKNTIFRTIEYIDLIIDRSSGQINSENDLECLALACLRISTKFNEEFNKMTEILSIKSLELHNTFTNAIMNEMEQHCLQYLGWNLNISTILDYISFYSAHGIIFHSDNNQNTINSQLLSLVFQYTQYFSELIIENYTIHQFSNHEIALCIIGISRSYCGLDPMLNLSFVHLWNIQNTPSLARCFDEINESLNLIMSEYKNENMNKEDTTCEGSEDDVSLMNESNMITPEKIQLSELKTPFCKCSLIWRENKAEQSTAVKTPFESIQKENSKFSQFSNPVMKLEFSQNTEKINEQDNVLSPLKVRQFMDEQSFFKERPQSAASDYSLTQDIDFQCFEQLGPF